MQQREVMMQDPINIGINVSIALLYLSGAGQNEKKLFDMISAKKKFNSLFGIPYLIPGIHFSMFDDI